jgi:glycosyltransferase involved in cell wall biosynthesis
LVRNAAAREAKGDFLAFLDSDDVWYPEKIERQVELLDRNPTVGLVCSNASVIDENGRSVQELYLQPPNEGACGDALEQLIDENFVIVSSAVVRRELFECAGLFSEDPRLRGVEDYDLWLRVSAVSDVAYLSDPLLKYREHRESMRFEVDRAIYWRSLLAALDNLDQFLNKNDRRTPVRLGRRRAQLLLELALSEVVDRKPLAAAISLYAALRTDPAIVASALCSTRALRAGRKAMRETRRPKELA